MKPKQPFKKMFKLLIAKETLITTVSTLFTEGIAPINDWWNDDKFKTGKIWKN